MHLEIKMYLIYHISSPILIISSIIVIEMDYTCFELYKLIKLFRDQNVSLKPSHFLLNWHISLEMVSFTESVAP